MTVSGYLNSVSPFSCDWAHIKKKKNKPNMSKHRTVAQSCCSAFINMERVKSQNVFSPSKWWQRLCDRAAGSSPLPVFNHPTCGRQPDSAGLLKGLLFPPRYSKRLISCLKRGTAQQTTRKEDYRPSFCLTFASQWADSLGLSTSTATDIFHGPRGRKGDMPDIN